MLLLCQKESTSLGYLISEHNPETQDESNLVQFCASKIREFQSVYILTKNSIRKSFFCKFLFCHFTGLSKKEAFVDLL